jgi:tetratricopeptide (TPR) repeat protein
MLDMALDHFKAGRLAEAADCCGKLLNRTSRDFQALHLLGRIRIRQAAFEEAVFFLSAALGAGSPDPNDTVATLNDLVAAELAQGNFDAAIDHARRALAIQPDNPVALQALGNALYGAERFDEAIGIYHQGLAAQPNSAGIYNDLGNALRVSGKLEEAAEAYRHAVTLRPDTAELHAKLGHILCLLECIDEAVECYRRAIAIDPNDADIRTVLGTLLRPRKQFEEACEHYRHALRLRPDEPEVLFGLGAALLGLFRCGEALGYLQRAAALRPAHVGTRSALGNALFGLNRVSEALQEYREGLALQPDSFELKQNAAFALLLVGDGSEGWREMEAGLSAKHESPLLELPDDMPYWRGETPIDGKTILLQAEQGLGDTLMMIRYLPLVAAQGARVLLRVQPVLGKLLADIPGAGALLTLWDPPPEADMVCPLMSLPLAFGTVLATIPATVPYIRTPPLYRMLWRTLLGKRTRPRIGIAWRGKQHLPYRTMPLAALEPLLRRTDIEFHGLQLDIPEADREWLDANPLLIDHSAEVKDFTDTAAIIEELDLIITIDTAVAHLAGALARPVWVMLPLCPDFRWLMDRPDTPWYPTARLFRQQREGDWAGVVADVLKALAALPL